MTTIDNNKQNGINVTTNDTSSLNFRITDTDISNTTTTNQATGYIAVHNDASLANVVFTDDTIRGNGHRLASM